jgi:hypothetical protein
MDCELLLILKASAIANIVNGLQTADEDLAKVCTFVLQGLPIHHLMMLIRNQCTGIKVAGLIKHFLVTNPTISTMGTTPLIGAFLDNCVQIGVYPGLVVDGVVVFTGNQSASA